MDREAILRLDVTCPSCRRKLSYANAKANGGICKCGYVFSDIYMGEEVSNE